MAIKGPTTIVICKRCKMPVEVQTAERVSEEFSVRCPKCGHRDLYRIKDLKTLSR
jgi:DNA-directed RNA polymerase subunit RPC12/RpoP